LLGGGWGKNSQDEKLSQVVFRPQKFSVKLPYIILNKENKSTAFSKQER
jgi:hypothetical protein